MALRARTAPTAEQLDRAHLGRCGPRDALEIVRADGSWLFDADGNRYIDFTMGWCVGNLGWNPSELRERLRRFDGPDYVMPLARYGPWGELAALLAEVTPAELTRAFRTTTGTESVELALEAAQSFTGRKKFVAIDGAYHGNSIGARSLARHTIKPPLDERALDRVESALRRRDVAAFIMEPIVCNLGVVIPSRDFMRGVGESCARHGTLFIADEVACGFGRTGKLFATEHYELEPDILCMAKAITAGLAPLGATILTDEVYAGLDDDFDFHATWGWHPYAVEAAIANVKYWKRHARALLGNVAARAAELEAGLGAIEFPCAAEVRIKGLAVGLEFDDDGYAAALARRCREAGLLIAGSGNLAMLFPALTVDADTVAAALDVIAQAAG